MTDMTQDTWLQRYANRFIEVAGLTPEQAAACASAESFDVLSEGYEDDPEAAADMEMSYWGRLGESMEGYDYAAADVLTQFLMLTFPNAPIASLGSSATG